MKVAGDGETDQKSAIPTGVMVVCKVKGIQMKHMENQGTLLFCEIKRGQILIKVMSRALDIGFA